MLAAPSDASLMARLDRLGRAKEVAQIGAVIGREFSHVLLASVARHTEADLEAALDRLIQAGLLFRQGMLPHATYLFKHSLVQDAAYGTLLREPRRALHARIAEALESQSRRSPRTSRNCWRITTAAPGSSRRRFISGCSSPTEPANAWRSSSRLARSISRWAKRSRSRIRRCARA
jgi:hypothetical protein